MSQISYGLNVHISHGIEFTIYTVKGNIYSDFVDKLIFVVPEVVTCFGFVQFVLSTSLKLIGLIQDVNIFLKNCLRTRFRGSYLFSCLV